MDGQGEEQETITVRVDGPRLDRELEFYSLSTCAMCRRAREFLDASGFAYTLTFVDRLGFDEKRLLKERLSARYGMRVVFPALAVDGQKIVLGFFREAWEEVLNHE